MRFIGLQRSDEVEFETGVARFERRPFLQGLLDPIFAENKLSGGDQWRNVLRGNGLGDADKGYVLRLAFRIARGVGDVGAHQTEAVEDGRGRIFALLQGFGLSFLPGRQGKKLDPTLPER
jgi:hypothetical protein